MENRPAWTVPARILHWASQQPDRNVYIFRSPVIGRTTLTRRNVKDMAFTFADRLANFGLPKGDVVCNTLQNSPERVVTDLGIMTAGLVMVDKRVFLHDLSDMVHVLNQSEARLVIVDPGERNEDGSPSAWAAIKSQCSAISDVDISTNSVTVTWADVKTLQRVLFCSRGQTGNEFEFLKSLEVEASDQVSSRKDKGTEASRDLVQPSDLAVLFLTSGSTGLAKLSAMTQASLLDNAENWQCLFRLQDDDIIFQDRPLGWLAGCQFCFLSTATTRVMTDGRTQTPEGCPDSVWSYIAQEGVTFAHLTPQMVSTILSRSELISKYRVKLRHLLMTGQPLKKHVVGKVIGILADTVYNAYGATELSYLTAVHCRAESEFEDFLVGYPHPWAEIRVLDENLQPVKTGVTGEVVVRCRGQMEGYYRDELKTQRTVLPGGWIRIDDVGRFDDDGRLYMFGRRSDAIMRGVVVVYPYTIEKRLACISGVEDVMVVAVPDPELYHEICACVVVTPGSEITVESLKKSCDEVNLQWRAELPTPRYVLLFESFPTTSTGKVSHKLLQQQACLRLGLEA